VTGSSPSYLRAPTEPAAYLVRMFCDLGMDVRSDAKEQPGEDPIRTGVVGCYYSGNPQRYVETTDERSGRRSYNPTSAKLTENPGSPFRLRLGCARSVDFLVHRRAGDRTAGRTSGLRRRPIRHGLAAASTLPRSGREHVSVRGADS
jgi:hypothetical protein